jgi:hypothetical protein
MQQQIHNTEGNKQYYFIPFDEFLYRKICDLCLDFVNTYKNLNDDDSITVTILENIMEALLDFAQNCDSLPDNIRNPPLEKWMLSPDNIHPRLALNYVMRLLNELKRQQDKVGRDRNYYVSKYMKAKKDYDTPDETILNLNRPKL